MVKGSTSPGNKLPSVWKWAATAT